MEKAIEYSLHCQPLVKRAWQRLVSVIMYNETVQGFSFHCLSFSKSGEHLVVEHREVIVAHEEGARCSFAIVRVGQVGVALHVGIAVVRNAQVRTRSEYWAVPVVVERKTQIIGQALYWCLVQIDDVLNIKEKYISQTLVKLA